MWPEYGQRHVRPVAGERIARGCRGRTARVFRERGVTEYAVVDHGHDMAAAGQPAYPAWTLIFGNPAAGARLLASDLAAAVDIPLRLAVIGRGDASEIVLRDMRTLIDADIADDFTNVLRGLAEAARERV
jgi:uncharacterized protein (DUF302 family)